MIRFAGIIVLAITLNACSMLFEALAHPESDAEAPSSETERPTTHSQTWHTLRPLGEVDVALTYARLCNAPIPYDDLIRGDSTYQSARNEFERRELAKVARATIDRVYAQLNGTTVYRLRKNYAIPEYDFAQHGFSTGLDESTRFKFGGRIYFGANGHTAAEYRLELGNGNMFAFAPVSEAAARSAIGRGRDATIDFEIEVFGCEDRSDGAGVIGTLLGRIRRIKVVSKAGVLAELPTQPATLQTNGSDES